MEPWLHAECRIRREDVLKNARGVRPLRREREQTMKVRMRVAAGAQAVSDAFAVLARRLRNGETG
jgi:hypothetical protein